MMRPSTIASIAMVLMILFVIFGIVYVCLGSIGESRAALPRMEPLTATFTSDDDVIKAYIIIDPDTGGQYIVTDHGGITPRFDESMFKR